jgi:predicted membrane protein (TIGR00267 family)
MLKRAHDLRRMLTGEDVGPIVRRFLINTLFDATFVLLGIIVGLTFAESNLRLVVTTMVASSFALGISTGVSVYEAESLEQERKISKLERSLFRDLTGTRIEKQAKSLILVVALINFMAPLFSCAVTISPLLMAIFGLVTAELASWMSVTLALGVLFGTGVYMGHFGKTSPWKKGLRMVLFGLLAFFVGYVLHNLV